MARPVGAGVWLLGCGGTSAHGQDDGVLDAHCSGGIAIIGAWGTVRWGNQVDYTVGSQNCR
jgi:hypothetical protein